MELQQRICPSVSCFCCQLTDTAATLYTDAETHFTPPGVLAAGSISAMRSGGLLRYPGQQMELQAMRSLSSLTMSDYVYNAYPGMMTTAFSPQPSDPFLSRRMSSSAMLSGSPQMSASQLYSSPVLPRSAHSRAQMLATREPQSPLFAMTPQGFYPQDAYTSAPAPLFASSYPRETDHQQAVHSGVPLHNMEEGGDLRRQASVASLRTHLLSNLGHYPLPQPPPQADESTGLESSDLTSAQETSYARRY